MKVRSARSVRSIRSPRQAATAAAAAAVLSLTAACGGASSDAGDKSGGRAEAKPAASATASAAADKRVSSTGETLGEGELKKVALVSGDVPDFAVTSLQGGDETGTERAEQPECQPLAAVINGAPEPTPSAAVHRTLTDESEEGNDDQTVVTEILTSYPEGRAMQVLRGVKNAVGACAGGFKTTGGDGPSTYTEVKELPAPKAGQEALAYQVTGSFEGTKVPLVFQLVRTGSTVVIFYAANFIDAKTPEIPAGLATAQAAKLP
ncbi:hypothetical protein J7E96_29475 [Streptomyces sp. ISL-96]|uniref:hypothetical protein n=1 Tax=Streptomyces sp. ISL-96 TaxID=2819191 RepID=UPI001BECE2BD|nr:hypothetical protein [Streptomyces sp. ISL-96]MBT2492565.1 hypothetical protein [Streptomyces sp. ISL-96]